MIKALGEVVRAVAILVLLTSFLDMLLPNNNLQRFIKVVMGLFIMVTILNPIVNLISQDMEINTWQLQLPANENVDTVLAQGRKVSDLQQYQLVEEYKVRVEQQIQAMVKLIPEVSTVECNITVLPAQRMGEIARINGATLWVTVSPQGQGDSLVKPVEPVIIKPSGQLEKSEVVNEAEVKEKILNIVANYFSIDRSAIEVNII